MAHSKVIYANQHKEHNLEKYIQWVTMQPFPTDPPMCQMDRRTDGR